ncbi:Uncharacterised protein [Mycobacteroides abscessus subsp. abscessus]|uniref:hypothetical protein n=1 Tax=Mycobacteroides abscessus TaxID=36809 RepID=UPI0009277354|nr:hypothetical protein [Mycobacteroides abscessus]SIH21138.1 Uncharacterised protein [Mycobacteroides abscessus subsp. abscessus]
MSVGPSSLRGYSRKQLKEFLISRRATLVRELQQYEREAREASDKAARVRGELDNVDSSLNDFD